MNGRQGSKFAGVPFECWMQMSKGGANVMVRGDYLFLSYGQANWLLNPCGGSQIAVSERNIERNANNVVCLVKQERCCFTFGSEFLQSPL